MIDHFQSTTVHWSMTGMMVSLSMLVLLKTTEGNVWKYEIHYPCGQQFNLVPWQQNQKLLYPKTDMESGQKCV